MEQNKGMQPVRIVVIIAIGAALYGVGGLVSVPVFANTTIKPAMAILALFADRPVCRMGCLAYVDAW